MGRKGYCRRSRFSAFMFFRRRGLRKSNGNFTCLSPWSIFSFWFSFRKTKGEKNVEKTHTEEDDSKYGEIEECMHGALDGLGDKKEVSFNMGVGFGIICIMAASKCESNLVQDSKMQLQNQQKHTIYGPSQSNKNSDAISSWDQISSCNITPKITKMDQLEAELEFELENLQVLLDTEVMMDSQRTEIVVEDSAPEESISTLSYGQVYDEPSEGIINMQNDGVCPLELERRLHELLEMRQEERIKVLESALEFAMQKLHENEKELSWWKDKIL